MKNFTPRDTLKIMELVAEITTALAGNEKVAWSAEAIDTLVRTLFPTMCELLEKANEGN